MTKIKEDGDGGGGGDSGGIGGGETPVGTDILTGGEEFDNSLGVLGIGNFNFPSRLGKIRKRLLSKYELLTKD